MVRNYILVAIRNILRQKAFSFINIFGLAIGLACTLLIFLWIQDELSFDKFHANSSTLYRVEQDQYYSGESYHVNVTPNPSGPVWKDEIPEIEDATRYTRPGGLLFKYEDKSFFENDIRAVDPSFLTMFTFPLKQGNIENVLEDPYSIVISEEVGQKYFGQEDPIGKSFRVNNQYDFKVTGVLEDLPHNSMLQFEMLIPFEFMKTRDGYSESWGSNSIFTYVQLFKNSPVDSVGAKLTQVVRSHNPESITDFMIAPFTKVRLHGYFGYGHSPGAIQFVYIFSAIALFVLVIACINFMNLSTARSASRAKEIGIRKVIGGKRKSIINQFLLESFILTIIALLAAIILVFLFIEVFNTISGKAISVNVLFKQEFILGTIFVAVVTGFLAGSYPAIFLSSFKPITVLKGKLASGAKRSFLRKGLVIIQFTLSIFLIAGTLIVYNQLNFMRNKKLGYNKDHLLYIPMRGGIKDSYKSIKNEFLKDSRILSVTTTSHVPTNIGSNSGGADWDGKDPEMTTLISISGVDFDYIKTLQIEMKEGRAFSEEFIADAGTDSTGNFLINEEVVKIMDVDSPVGMNFSFMGISGEIIGVMKNFHYQSVRNKIEPLAVFIAPKIYLDYILVRVQPDQVIQAMDYLEGTWGEVLPGHPFDYRFIDENLDNMYRTEARMGTLIKYFAIVAIFIACLGLFGLTSYTAEQRTKEIGIRKTMGATVPKVVFLLSTEFLVLVILSMIIAIPASWYFMDQWLQDYAYRTQLSWWIFAIAAVIVMIIAILTVSYQAIKTGLTNPAEALRYE
jgi:predicted permease